MNESYRPWEVDERKQTLKNDGRLAIQDLTSQGQPTIKSWEVITTPPAKSPLYHQEVEEIENEISRALHLSTRKDSVTQPIIQTVEVTVVQATGLPEAAGGKELTNPYAVVEWGPYGSQKTQPLKATTCPKFGSYLKFKSPFKIMTKVDQAKDKRGNSSIGARSRNIAALQSGLLQIQGDANLSVCIWSHNESCSHDYMCQGTVSTDQIMKAFQSSARRQVENELTARILIPLHQYHEHAGSIELLITLDC